MTLDEAEDLMEIFYEYENLYCTCFKNAPCSYCVNMPSEEELLLAERVLYGD